MTNKTMTYVAPDGEEVYLVATAGPLHDAQGHRLELPRPSPGHYPGLVWIALDPSSRSGRVEWTEQYDRLYHPLTGERLILKTQA